MLTLFRLGLDRRLDLDYDAAQEWCMTNLPPPEQSEEEGMEDYGGYTSEELSPVPVGAIPRSTGPGTSAVVAR
jgi:hypothetical protein